MVSCLQAAAQDVAAHAATGELASSLKSAEARNAALTESLNELQEALERQRAAADLREEMLRQVRQQGYVFVFVSRHCAGSIL